MTAAVKPTAVAELPRKIKELDNSAVTKNADGFCFREFVVRLPAQMTVNDLIEQPKLWRLIQGDARSALRKFDRVLILTFDEDVAAEALVSAASDTAVTLSKPRLIELQSRSTDPQLEDELHRVVWQGNGYAVLRKKDGQIVTPTQASRLMAERDLVNLRPRPAA